MLVKKLVVGMDFPEPGLEFYCPIVYKHIIIDCAKQ